MDTNYVKIKDRCQSCGDIQTLYTYNRSKVCKRCLGSDWKGIFRQEIFDKNTGKFKNELRRNRKRNR